MGDGAEGGRAEAPGSAARAPQTDGEVARRQRGRAAPAPAPQQLGANGPAWTPTASPGGSLSPPLPPSPRPVVAAGTAAVPRPTGPVTQHRLGQVGYVRTAPSAALSAVRGGLTRFRVGGSQEHPRAGDPGGNLGKSPLVQEPLRPHSRLPPQPQATPARAL